MQKFDRRKFIKRSGQVLAGASLFHVGGSSSVIAKSANISESFLVTPLKKKYRAAAIGSTGRGNYGHRMDIALQDLPGVDFVAIADHNPEGLRKAGERNRVDRLYNDYRKLLEDDQLDMVSIGTRHSELHEEMIVNCAEAGKHIY